jgi:DNA-binding transcriptional LysR family regulator
MKLTLAQLESFHWIAQLGSFGAAAEHLHLSQPAISVRLAGLERAVGKPLFKRQGRRMRLTPAGVALVEQAAHMLSLANGMVSEPAALDPLQFRLRIGAPDSFALVCLPQLLETFEHEYPRLKVALTIENSSVLAQSLNDGDLDIAFVAEPQVNADVRTEYLGSMRFNWVASPRLGLPRRRARSAELAKYQIFTNPDPSKLNALTRDWFARAGHESLQFSTCNNLSVIVQLTVSGAGISLLPTSIVEGELRSRQLRRVLTTTALPLQRFFACYRMARSGKVVADFVDLARKVMRRKRFLER